MARVAHREVRSEVWAANSVTYIADTAAKPAAAPADSPDATPDGALTIAIDLPALESV